MTKGNFPVEKFESIETPFYYYDAELLRQTLKTIIVSGADVVETLKAQQEVANNGLKDAQ